MSHLETLADSLRRVAKQMRLNRLLQELASAACWLSGALVVYQILKALISVPAVIDALGALLIVALGCAVVIFGLRLIRKPSLAQAAGEADERAKLKDEIKSAYWFARREHQSSLVTLQLQGAATTAQRLNPYELVPTVFPRSFIFAAALALVAGSLAWFSPRLVFPKSQTETAGARSEAQRGKLDSNKDQARNSVEAKQVQSRSGDDANWAKLEHSLPSFKNSEHREAIDAAVQVRDGRRAAQLLEQLERERAITSADPSVRKPQARSAGGAESDLIAILQSLFDRSGNLGQQDSEALSDNALQRAMKLAQKLDDQRRAAETANPARHALDESAANPIDRAVPLSSYGERQAGRGEGQGGQPAGSTNVEGGAMGRRVTQTTLGEGGNPEGNAKGEVKGDDESEPVMGKRTMRLQAQLQRVKIESKDDDDAGATMDRFYAATRSQQSKLDYQSVAQRPRHTREDAMSGERVPLAYRNVVKDYFLNLRQKEQ